jgi:SPW repeat
VPAYSIEQQPDIVALRASYDPTAESMPAQATFGLTLLTALYAAISPWVVGFDATTRLTVNDLITGLAAAVLVIGFASALDRTHGLRWVTPLLGVWMIVSPWILRGVNPTAGMIWSNVVSGGLLVVLGLGPCTSERARIDSHDPEPANTCSGATFRARACSHVECEQAEP